MRERLTARVLLFDPDGRILLMKGRLPGGQDGPSFWFTIGGGAEPGETAREAAAREIVEESGIDDFELGPTVWRRDGPLTVSGELVMFIEHYIVARCTAVALSRAGWDAQERALIDDLRWWSLDDLRACTDVMHPSGLADRLPELIAGNYPREPRTIGWP